MKTLKTKLTKHKTIQDCHKFIITKQNQLFIKNIMKHTSSPSRLGAWKSLYDRSNNHEIFESPSSEESNLLNILHWSVITLHASITPYSMNHVQYSFIPPGPIIMAPCHLNLQSPIIIGTNHLTLFSLVNFPGKSP